MQRMDKKQSLDSAYRSTLYVVFDLNNAALRIDEPAPSEIDECLKELDANSCVFLTAWNPSSLQLPLSENDRRNAELATALHELGHPFLPGEGRGLSGDWPPERSFLVVGISRRSADVLADRFGQNAYVSYSLGGLAELVWRERE